MQTQFKQRILIKKKVKISPKIERTNCELKKTESELKQTQKKATQREETKANLGEEGNPEVGGMTRGSSGMQVGWENITGEQRQRSEQEGTGLK